MENPIDTALRDALEAVDELIITIDREEGAGDLYVAAERARSSLLQHAKIETEKYPTIHSLGLPPWAMIVFILAVLFAIGLVSFGNDSRNSDDDSQQWSARAHGIR
jgi:hypothetical protein